MNALPDQLTAKSIRTLYPAVLGDAIVPLKVGIFKDLLERHQGQIARKTLYVLLGLRTSLPSYLAAVAAGGPRYALDGTVAGEVTEQERMSAKDRLADLARRREASDLEKKTRSSLLKEFEASGWTRDEFAQSKELTQSALDSILERATSERAERRAKQLQIVKKFEASGLPMGEYVKQSKVSMRKLERCIAKVGAMRATAPKHSDTRDDV